MGIPVPGCPIEQRRWLGSGIQARRQDLRRGPEAAASNRKDAQYQRTETLGNSKNQTKNCCETLNRTKSSGS